MMNKILFKFMLVALITWGCVGPAPKSPAAAQVVNSICSRSEIENQMTTLLTSTYSSVDFTYLLKRTDGKDFSYSRGASLPSSLVDSEASSKLISSVVILWLVDQGYLALTDRPEDHIPGWPISAPDPLANITLHHLLSSTSGLETESSCVHDPSSLPETCANTLASDNAGNGIIPGNQFFDGNSHLYIAGVMAYKARGVSDWQTVWTEFKNNTGLFSHSNYELPSTTNPRLASGMRWSAEDYLEFLDALRKNQILSFALQSLLISDQVGNTLISYSPPLYELGQDWHFSYGLWQECSSPSWNCSGGTRMSNPGSYGSYPIWDIPHGYVSVLSRQDNSGQFEDGITIEKTIRPQVESWSKCQHP